MYFHSLSLSCKAEKPVDFVYEKQNTGDYHDNPPCKQKVKKSA